VPDVIVGSGRKLYCFSWVGGRKRWMTRAETYFDSAMAAADGKVFTKNIGGELACYSPQQPKPLWKVQTDPQPSPYAAPAAGQGKIVDADANGRRLRAFSASDGSLAWQVLLPGETNAPIGAPTIAGDSVIVGDGDTGLYCFSLADGKERWQSSIPHVTTAAAVAGDSVFVADGTAAMHCLTLANGQSKWNFPVAFGFSGAPALADVNGDKILDAVALSHNGNVYAIDGATGEMLWRLQVTDARARTRNRVLLADLNGNGRPDGILALANGTLVSIDLKAGKTKWTYPLAAAVMAEPAIADLNGDGVPDVVVGTMGRRVRCISGKGDRELWSYEVGAQMRYSVPLILANGDAKNLPLLMIGTGPPENGLYCLSANGPRIKDRGWLGPWSELTSRR
jgi:outer membrane protein assembly factor BamB